MPDRPIPEDAKIEITPEMIAAGQAAAEEGIEAVFRAMMAANPDYMRACSGWDFFKGSLYEGLHVSVSDT
jgi:hypothetical protein